MKVVSLSKRKGGVFSTVTACNLAVAAAADGFSTVLVDLNVQQKSAAKWGERRALRTEDGPAVVAATGAQLEPLLAALRAECDLVILDTAPHGDDASLAAMRAADIALSPCGPSRADMETLDDVWDLHRRSKSDARIAVLITRYSVATKARADEVEAAQRAKGREVVPCRIRRLVAADDAFDLGVGVSEFDPRGEAAADIACLWTYVKEAIQ